MRPAANSLSSKRAKALDEKLAAWIGWFSPAPLTDDMAALVEQLEAQHAMAKARSLQG